VHLKKEHREQNQKDETRALTIIHLNGIKVNVELNYAATTGHSQATFPP
jgi:hypothetical protein